MELQRFLEVLPKIGTQPLAILAYICLVGGWLIRFFRKRKSADFLKALDAVPRNERANFAQKAGYRYDELAQLSNPERISILTRRYRFLAYIATLIGVVLILLSIIITPKESEEHTRLAKELPDVALRFVYPKSPALVLVNQSAVIARDIKWTVLLWNMDLPDRNDPLPIPISPFNWIRPHDQGGPQNLFGSPLVAPLLKPGDRLFGSASVICPECARGRTYIVYIVWDDSGWFSEVENVTSGRALIPSNRKAPRIEDFKELEALAPAQSRTPIGER